MDELIQTGKKRTILLSISILLVSLTTIYLYHSAQDSIETKKLVQQIVRFAFTLGLLFAIYYGKNWARILAIILFSLALLGALFGLAVPGDCANKIPLLVMIFIYGLGIFHFGFAQSFKAFFHSQQY